MKTIIHLGPDHAESSSRRYMLRAAGFEVIAVQEPAAVAQLAVEHGADLVLLEPGSGARGCKVAATPLSGIAVVDLDLDWETLARQSRGSELSVAVCALLRLNASEQALRESDARFRSVADAAPVLIWSSALDRLRDYFNQPWLHFTGRAAEQELGEGWAQGIYSEDRDRYLTAYRNAFDERSDFEVEYNAIKFTRREGSVAVALVNAGGQAQITVTDNGPGIEAQFLPHVFDHFRQQDSTTTRKYGGLGLGLAIVRHVVELHGGQVRAQNVNGEHGAMFVVTLPYEREQAAPAPKAVIDRA